MPQAVDSLATQVEQLADRLRDLEARLSALEKLATAAKNAIPSGAEPSRGEALAESRTNYSSAKLQSPAPLWPALSSGIFPTLGKAVLGFAGAFLLRAIAESNSNARLPVLAIAVLYAFFWMLWAIHPDWLFHRSRPLQAATRLTSALYALTSALILSPLLWESTIRFHVLSTAAASVILVAFVAMTLALCSEHELQLIPWIAALSAVITALTLIIATRDLVPLTAALLAISLFTEATTIFGHQLTFRAIPAVFSNFGVWLLISVLTSDPLPEGYHRAARATLILLAALLPTIYAASIAVRGFVELNCFTVFEVAQAAISFALATYGAMRVTQHSAAPALGTIFLLLALICYWGTLSRFAADPHTRNRHVTAYAALTFLLTGSFLLLPNAWELSFLCLAALITTILYARTLKLTLGLHASFYIAAAVALSSLPEYFASAIAGSVPSAPRWPELSIAISAALVYAIGSRDRSDQIRRRMLWTVPAFVAVASLAAIFVSAVVRLSPDTLAASQLSVIRTVVIGALAVFLALSSREPRIELGWIAYAAVALGSLKLVLEDLRFGNPASLVLSFFFYGLVLILLPRLTRRSRTER